MEELAERYRAALERWFLPFIRQHEYVLENYLINYIFRTLFPYRTKRPDRQFAIDASRESMRNAFLLMATHYALIRTLLIGLAARHREQFGAGHVVKLVQSYSKGFLHSGTFENSERVPLPGWRRTHPQDRRSGDGLKPGEKPDFVVTREHENICLPPSHCLGCTCGFSRGSCVAIRKPRLKPQVHVQANAALQSASGIFKRDRTGQLTANQRLRFGEKVPV